jgi:hypothetical protein
MRSQDRFARDPGTPDLPGRKLASLQKVVDATGRLAGEAGNGFDAAQDVGGKRLGGQSGSVMIAHGFSPSVRLGFVGGKMDVRERPPGASVIDSGQVSGFGYRRVDALACPG